MTKITQSRAAETSSSGLVVRLPTTLAVKRLNAPLELTTASGSRIVIVDPPDEIVEFGFSDILDAAIKLYELGKGLLDGGGGDGGEGGGDNDTITVTVKGSKGRKVTVEIE